MTQLLFKESSGGYGYRTYKNASADVTLAFAVDFSTAGERLTAKAVSAMGKLYIPMSIDAWADDPGKMHWDIIDAARGIAGLGLDSVAINVAGNGIYTMAKHGLSQEDIDHVIAVFMQALRQKLDSMGVKIRSIQSGGQTGVDEAGIKAAIEMNIPAMVIAPKGWLFRNTKGKDMADEALFKERFNVRRTLD